MKLLINKSRKSVNISNKYAIRRRTIKNKRNMKGGTSLVSAVRDAASAVRNAVWGSKPSISDAAADQELNKKMRFFDDLVKDDGLIILNDTYNSLLFRRFMVGDMILAKETEEIPNSEPNPNEIPEIVYKKCARQILCKVYNVLDSQCNGIFNLSIIGLYCNNDLNRKIKSLNTYTLDTSNTSKFKTETLPNSEITYYVLPNLAPQNIEPYSYGIDADLGCS